MRARPHQASRGGKRGISTVRSDRQGRAGDGGQSRHRLRHRAGGGGGRRGRRHLGHQRGEERKGARGAGKDRADGAGAAMRRRRRGGGRCGLRRDAERDGTRGRLLRQRRDRRRWGKIVPGDEQRALAPRAARQPRRRVLHLPRRGAAHGGAWRRRRSGRYRVAGGDRGLATQRALCGDQVRHDLGGALARGGVRAAQRARARDPAGVDRDGHDAAADHERDVPQQGDAADPDAALGPRRRFRWHRGVSDE
jgi:hypothetical protein